MKKYVMFSLVLVVLSTAFTSCHKTDAYDPDVSSFFFCYGGPGKVIVMYFPERESTFGFSDLYFYIGKVPADDIENIHKEQFMQENEKVYTFRRDS